MMRIVSHRYPTRPRRTGPGASALGGIPSLYKTLALTLFGLAATGCPAGTGDGPPDAGEVLLVVSEAMAKNSGTLADEHGEFDDWIEIHNRGDRVARLAGYNLSDKPDDLSRYAFPDDTTLEAGGFLLVWADGAPEQGPLHASFKLSGGGENAILSLEGTIVSQLTFGAQCDDESFGRDSSGAEGALAAPTPLAANGALAESEPDCPEPEPTVAPDAGPLPPSASDIVLNEIVSQNQTGLTDAAGTPRPWLELFNASDETQSLRDHALSDRAAQPVGWVFPDDAALDVGDYLIVFVDGSITEGPLHAALSANPAGGHFALTAPDGQELTRLTYPALDVDIAYGASSAGPRAVLQSPTPGAPNADAASPNLPDAGANDAGPSDAGANDAANDAGTGPDGGSDAGL